MSKILSLRIAITSVLILFFGGLGVIGTVEISNIWAYAIWGVALLWYLGLFIYLPQKIYVQDLNCEYGDKTSDVQGRLGVVLSGRISARHKDSLQNMCLYLPEYIIYPDTGIVSTPSFDESMIIDSQYRKFKVTFAIDEHVRLDSRENQERGKAIDWAILGFRTAGAEYRTKPFTLPSKEGGKMKIEKRKTGKEKVITKEQFHKLLKKVPQ